MLEFPKAIFFLGGVGPLKEKLREQVRDLKLEKSFIFEDFQQISHSLHLIDIFLLPSRNEGQSRTLVEAMALKKAIVASAVGGVPDVIQDGKTGLLVPSEDPQALAQAILQILRDPQKGAEMGEASSQDARKRYSLDTMVEKLESLYQRLLNDRGLMK